MSEQSPDPGPRHGGDLADIPKGAGCVIGGVSLVVAIVATAFVTAAIGGLGTFAGLLAIAGLAYAATKVPGFLLGVGITLAIGAVLFGACLATINSMY